MTQSLTPNEQLTIAVYYGAGRNILSLESLNLTPEDASKLCEVISALALGYPELHSLEQPENEVKL